MTVPDQLDAMAAANGGVLCVKAATRAGISRASYDRWVRARQATRLAPGVHLVATGGTRSERCLRLLRAALFANGGLDGNAALAGRSALWAHGVVRRPEPLRVAIGADACRTSVKGVKVVRVNRKLPFTIVSARGWPSLGVPHALLDLAREVDDIAHLAICCDALREGKLDIDAMLRLLSVHPGMHGSTRATRSLARLEGIRPDAVSEVLIREGLHRVGIMTEPRPRWIPTPFGTFQVDVPLKDLPGGVECDSVTHHGQEADLTRDHDKTNSLAIVHYRLLRFSYTQIVHNLDDCVAKVQALVTELTSPPGPSLRRS